MYVYVKKIEMEQKYTYAAQHLKGLFVIVNGWNDGWKMLLVHAILEKDNRKASDCLQE